MSSGGNLIFMSWNSNGLKSKIQKVMDEINKQNCHVVFLQEIRSCKNLKKPIGWKLFYSTQTSNQRGVAILIREDIFDDKFCYEEIKDVDSCYVVVKCTLKGQLFTLVSVYNPQTDPRPLMKIQNVIEKISEGILLIAGDFNIALNPYLDRNSKTINTNHLHFKPLMNKFMTSFHLVDVWRRFHPTERQYSYEQRNVMSRLDYLLVPEESMQYITMCDISEKIKTFDHRQILFKIGISDEEVCMNSTEQVNKIDIFNLIKSVSDTWLSCKLKHCPKPDLTINPCTPLMISAREVESSIQTLAVNQRHLKRPDGIPLSFYVNNSYALTPCLCAFYHNILEHPMSISESFNEALEVSETLWRFNVDYLILATILAKWLSDHMESHSTDYTDDGNNKALLFTFEKETTIDCQWSVLRRYLATEKDKTKTSPPLSDKINIDIFDRILRNNPGGKWKSLCWGCPLTPVLNTLCLKHIANEMIGSEPKEKPKICISRENIIFRFSSDFDTCELRNLRKKKYRGVVCGLVD